MLVVVVVVVWVPTSRRADEQLTLMLMHMGRNGLEWRVATSEPNRTEPSCETLRFLPAEAIVVVLLLSSIFYLSEMRELGILMRVTVFLLRTFVLRIGEQLETLRHLSASRDQDPK